MTEGADGNDDPKEGRPCTARLSRPVGETRRRHRQVACSHLERARVAVTAVASRPPPLTGGGV